MFLRLRIYTIAISSDQSFCTRTIVRTINTFWNAIPPIPADSTPPPAGNHPVEMSRYGIPHGDTPLDTTNLDFFLSPHTRFEDPTHVYHGIGDLLFFIALYTNGILLYDCTVGNVTICTQPRIQTLFKT